MSSLDFLGFIGCKHFYGVRANASLAVVGGGGAPAVVLLQSPSNTSSSSRSRNISKCRSRSSSCCSIRSRLNATTNLVVALVFGSRYRLEDSTGREE